MIVALIAAFTIDSATLCVRDADTMRAMLDVRAVDSVGVTRILPAACNRLPLGTYTLRAIGYESRQATLTSPARALVVGMHVRFAPVTLRRVTVSEVGMAGFEIDRDAALARTLGTMQVADARTMGIGTVTGLVSSLPFAAPRSARGELGLSLRGARREAVGVTLDGLPLNDPATGIADVSDLPLVMLRSATVALGSDPINVGSGATGGVLALHSASMRAASMRLGAFGARSVEGAWNAIAGNRVLYSSAGYRTARNDFAFDNDAAVRDGATTPRETRVNNDERRAVGVVGVAGEHAQTLLLVSTGERGMVGAANVRTYDNDRSRTTRVLLRTQAGVSGMRMLAGVRALELAYRDPTRTVLDTRSRAAAADIELRGLRRQIAWRIGGGADRVTDGASLEQSRARGFAALTGGWNSSRTRLEAGARVDAVGTLGVLPSFNIAASRSFLGDPLLGQPALSVGARVAQAVRVPTLYDLYFSSPQRLFVRTLRPERVSLDAEFNADISTRTPLGMLGAHGSIVARDTRNAIIWFPGNFGWSPSNVGVERLRGAEGRVSLERSRLSLSAWATWYDTQLITGALRIPTPYIARAAGGGQLAVRVGASVASAIARSAGSRPFTAGPRNPAFELPGTTLVDLALSHRFVVRPGARFMRASADALVALSLENATDLSWQSVRGFPAPGRAWAVNITLSPASRR